MKSHAFNLEHTADRRTDLIGPILTSLSEYAHPRPFLIVARMARGFFDFRGIDLIHMKQNFDVRKIR